MCKFINKNEADRTFSDPDAASGEESGVGIWVMQ